MPKSFETLAVMVDCSRNAVASPDFLRGYIDRLARMGFNTLMLYIEDTYEIKEEPYFGYRRGRYTKEELKSLDAYAAERGIALVPCFQTLAHLERILFWLHYDKLQDIDDILLADNEETYQLIEHMFASISECFSSRLVHIGMDEAHYIGRGRYRDLFGERDRADILLRHLGRVSDIGRRYGLRMLVWGDMFFRLATGHYLDAEPEGILSDISDRIPDNIELVYWDYFKNDAAHFERHLELFDRIKEGSWFAGALWSWLGFVPHNRYSIEALRVSVEACRRHGCRHLMLTMWGDDGAECARLSHLPALYYAARLAQGESDDASIRAGFAEEFGIAFDDFMLLDLPGTPQERGNLLVDVDKYMLYDDPFTGILNEAAEEGGREAFAALADRLETLGTHPDFGYLFKDEEMLCRALAEKYGLGKRVREAYSAGDRAALSALTDDFRRAEESLEAFYQAFEARWHRENKPNGFEVQDIRLGGLKQRLIHCRARLEGYLRGEIPELTELTDESLRYREEQWPYVENHWRNIVSVHLLT